MKVELQADGTIGIKAETGCESFALDEWSNRVDWNAAIASGLRLWVETHAVREEVKRPEPMRDRLARAERALIRAGYTYTEGAEEWKPPIGRPQEKDVSVIYTGPDGFGWRSFAPAGSEQHASTAHDGASIVVEQDAGDVRVSVMVPQAKQEKRDRKADVAVMAEAIFGAAANEGVVNPWTLAGTAYDALFSASEKRS